MSDTPTETTEDWRNRLDERQRQEVAFAEVYATDFNHGTTGHNQLLLIARLAGFLDHATQMGGELPPPPDPAEIVLTFGKYRGLTLWDVAQQDSGYLDWLSREGREEALRQAAGTVLERWYDSLASDVPYPDEPPF
jgi:hypothetical protein